MNGTGSIQYPVSLYLSDIPETSPVWIIIAKMLFLQVLGILNIVLLISLVSHFTKNRLHTLLLSILIIVGSPITLKAIETLHLYMHTNPFTYLASGDVVTYLMAHETNNPNITFGNGIRSLTVFAILLMSAIIFVTYRKERQQILAKK